MTGSLRIDRRGATALEFALVFPVFLLFIFGLFAGYSLISCRRAMDYGIEKALRYATVHGGGGTAGVSSAYAAAAAVIWPDVGANSSVSVTPSTFKAGDTVSVSVTYNWAAPAGLKAPENTVLFAAVMLSASGSMRVTSP
jgi:Flp pilus assembly protein TadG